MRPDAAARRDAIVALYRKGRDVPEIAAKLGVSKTTVWRWLRLAGVPRTIAARRTAPISILPRPPYWELRKQGPQDAPSIVLGRRFCSGCGRWRQLCDYPVERREGYPEMRPRCLACRRAAARYYSKHISPEALANRRERHRIYCEGKRRERGVKPTTARRRSVVDRVERIFFDPTPVVLLLARMPDPYGVAKLAGVPERTLLRYLTGESRHIRIDVADRIAIALDVPLALLYPEDAAR